MQMIHLEKTAIYKMFIKTFLEWLVDKYLHLFLAKRNTEIGKFTMD